MENFEYFVITFREALSVLYDTSSSILSRFYGGKWASANVINETKLKTIMQSTYNTDFTDVNEIAFEGVTFVEWDTNNSRWNFKPLCVKFIEYLVKEYGESYCVNSPTDEDNDLVKSCTSFMDNILNLIQVTFPKYQELYTAIEAEKGQLLRGVNSENNNKAYSKFKDTPQGSVTLATLDSDNYNTNVTINESENTLTDERDTPIARIKEIQERYVNLFEEWSKEFKAFFWEG